MAHSEETLQRYVADLMRTDRADPRVVWTHVANEAMGPPWWHKKQKELGKLSGFPDCIFLLPGGRYACLELKTKIGRQSPAQKDFQRRVQAIEGPYLIARDPVAVDGILSALGIVTRPALKVSRAA